MTNTTAAKLAALSAEAADHGDAETVRMCAAALAGDKDTLADLRDQLRNVKLAADHAAKLSRAAAARKPKYRTPTASSHPFSHDES